ncbi:MAG: L-seryl-tRNA(Sec) selenium transferase [Caldilineaceae bacterium]|nr:L-seryl-tRNA(Sec) selenium transferase [Caldilineaceae bacterium]
MTSLPAPNVRDEYRKLPAVDALLRRDDVVPLAIEYGDAAVSAAVRTLLDEARTAIAAGATAPPEADWPTRIAARLASKNRSSLRTVINATGVIIHTNLGRAPLSSAARQAMEDAAAGYNTLEYNLEAGERGSRSVHTRDLLAELTGAEDAMAVNNNAAAVYLVLSALCSGRDVLISRGELVEIGGGFRIPDVLSQSGASLREVGTTNRTHLSDFEQALTPETAAILRVHSSNFRQIGFVTQPTLVRQAALLHEYAERTGKRPLLIDDLGSGTLLETRAYGLAPEPTVQMSIADGADLVTFSGDKLLGGPQAGLIVGRGELIAALRRHPLARALRVDKLTLAGLEATLQSYRRGAAAAEIPVWQMISAPLDQLESRALNWQAALAAAGIEALVEPGESAVGGGALPGETLATRLLVLTPPAPHEYAARLRRGNPPIIVRISRERLLLDPRTVRSREDEELIAGIKAAWAQQGE